MKQNVDLGVVTFNVVYGSYSSTRFHLAGCEEGGGQQVIHRNDSDNSRDLAPNSNNCPT